MGLGAGVNLKDSGGDLLHKTVNREKSSVINRKNTDKKANQNPFEKSNTFTRFTDNREVKVDHRMNDMEANKFIYLSIFKVSEIFLILLKKEMKLLNVDQVIRVPQHCC